MSICVWLGDLVPPSIPVSCLWTEEIIITVQWLSAKVCWILDLTADVLDDLHGRCKGKGNFASGGVFNDDKMPAEIVRCGRQSWHTGTVADILTL